MQDVEELLTFDHGLYSPLLYSDYAFYSDTVIVGCQKVSDMLYPRILVPLLQAIYLQHFFVFVWRQMMQIYRKLVFALLLFFNKRNLFIDQYAIIPRRRWRRK